MSRFVRSSFGSYNHLQNLNDHKYVHVHKETNVNTLGNFCINQKIGMLPLTPYVAPKTEPFMAIPIPNNYHTGAKYGATPYTSSLVSGKMHKIISK